MSLRDYQQAAVDAAISWIKQSVEPAVLDLATGAGKSHIVAELAKEVKQISGKKVLCLAPSKELVEQNHSKYLATGNKAGIYCASLGKDLRHDVVFGSPQTVKNSIDKFCGKFACVIVDECHGITRTVKDIIAHIKSKNDKLRIIGLTATPYRLTTGYIYAFDEKHNPIPEWQTADPYFHKLLYRVDAQYLIDKGYLTQPHADPDHIKGYDTSNLELNKMGKFDEKQVEQVFEGHGNLTADIVADIVYNSRYRQGVIVFAATRRHANEVMASLPPDNSRLITGKTSKADREKIISDFKDKQFKYLVNVAVLTTGFDAPHVDVVAILRATESVSLLQQIIGRGLRLADPSMATDLVAIANSEKPDCLVLDYAGNIERHCPDGDLFNPEIRAKRQPCDSDPITCHCPSCGTENEFKGRPNDEGFEVDKHGYFVDLSGKQIMTDDDQPMPAHFGRRCMGGEILRGLGTWVQCDYRWTFKECAYCGHENDIAARQCSSCKELLVDPNEKLKIEYKRIKKDPYTATSDKVLSWSIKPVITQKGNSALKVEFVTEYRTINAWFIEYDECSNEFLLNKWRDLCRACGVFDKKPKTASAFIKANPTMPDTITARKNKGNGMFDIQSYNQSEFTENEI